MSFKKLVFGFLIAISIAISSAVFSTYTVLNSQSNINELTGEIYPYVEKLNELDMMFTKSRMLITNWVYLPYSIEDKKELMLLQEEKYPKLKKELKSQLNESFSKKDRVMLDSIFIGFEELVGIQEIIMETLPDAPSYEDPIALFDTEEIIETEVLPQTTELLSKLEGLILANKTLADKKENAMIQSLDLLKIVVIGFGIMIVLVMFFSYLYIQRKIAQPILQVRNNILDLSVGKKPVIETRHSGNVIGKMEQAVVKLSDNFASTAKFAREIGNGDYEANYNKLSEDDELGNALLVMRNKLADYAHSMEEKVADRTRDLENKQKELQELNENLSASEEEIRQNSEELMAVNENLKETSTRLEEAFSKEQETNQQLEKILADLKETQAQLVQSEKMSSLGQLTAGVAHEINNPINFVYAGANTLKDLIGDLSFIIDAYNSIGSDLTTEESSRKLAEINKKKEEIYFDEIQEDIKELVNDILHGAERTQAIVKSLRTFTRLDENEIKPTDLHENIDSTLIILNTKLKDRIEINKKYSESLPNVECLPGPINQVFMNIISNAAQAIKGKGEITIRTEYLKDSSQVQIEISDSGKGMSEETKQKLFDPFYTTKDVGEGTGLGLSIVHGIIEEHNGEITVESELDKGSTFKIILPIKQEA